MEDHAIAWSSVVVLGVIEGLTEFLPISSTGHLIVAAHFLEDNTPALKLFEVVIQLGAILAVCWHYRDKFLPIFYEKPSLQNPSTRLVLNLLIAFMPAAVLGLLFYSFIKTHLFSPVTVGVALVVGGAIIILVERQPRPPRITCLQDIKPRDAFIIGCFQSLALFPGTSRSGATIIGGLLWGLNRQLATEFSFLLAMPTMFAAVFYDLYKNTAILDAQLGAHILGGLSVSFIVALITIKTLLKFVAKYKFTVFGWYRIAFGVMILILIS